MIADNMQMNRLDSLMSQDESEKLQLFFSCRNLADLDFITVTDSFLVLKLQQLNKPEKKILQTKVYWNDLNPDYAQTVTIDYFFQIRQKLKIQVYHQAKPPKLVGRVETTLGELFGSSINGFKKPLMNQNNKKSGEIMVKCEKVQKVPNNILQFALTATNLPTSFSFCCFGSETSAFYRIYRPREKDQLLIYESQTVFDNPNPRFRKVTLSERRLCKNNPDAIFQVRFYNYSSSGHHDWIGSTNMTVNNIVDTKNFSIQDKHNKIKGSLKADQIRRTIKHRFGQYISAGLQLLLITCIDFTASNGSAKFPSSLHFIAPNKKSQYQQALEQVSRILLDYDSDKLVPVYGFGAKCHFPTFNSYGKVHHCFPLNGNQENAHVFQVQGIMQTYRNSIPHLQFGGPTHFSGLLDQAISECVQLQKEINQYMIVFILTDGQIHDKQRVIDQIIRCCTLPISLIIVGVGNGPFDIMDELDDDDCQLMDSKGNRTTRDLVQFVEFRKFKNSGMQLARQVLQQLPRQVQQYYQMMNISPMQIQNMQPNLQMQQQMQFSAKGPYQPPQQPPQVNPNHIQNMKNPYG